MGYYVGEVQQGAIVLDPPVILPEGAKVRVMVEPIEILSDEDGPTLLERLQSVVGKAEGLPSDLAENHDHYLHGTPKR